MARNNADLVISLDELKEALESPADGHLWVTDEYGKLSVVPGAITAYTWPGEPVGKNWPIQVAPNSMPHGYFAQQGDLEATLAILNELLGASPEITAIEHVMAGVEEYSEEES